MGYVLEAERTSRIDGQAARALLESDRRYFELGASTERIDRASIAYMPGLEGTPGGCVVHSIAPPAAAEAEAWLDRLEEWLDARGCRCRRLYFDGSPGALEPMLLRRGYRAREETGWLARTGAGRERSDVALRPVVDDRDWADKLAFHAVCDGAPVGHGTGPEDWTALERRKCEGGQMRAYLITVAGEVCGAIGEMQCAELLRVKNLIIGPDRRGEGIGAAAIRLLARSTEAIGLFALPQSSDFYRRVGMYPAIMQVEWSR